MRLPDPVASIRAGTFGQVTSLVVAGAGEMVAEEYFVDGPATLRNTRSCTKTVVGLLLGIAIERGLVEGVEVPVADLLQRRPRRYSDPRKEAITLGDLLTMSSCLECDDSNMFSAGNEERMYPREDWVQFALDLPVRGSTGFSYCTAGVVLLGVALERAVGEPLSRFAGRELFAPLGIEHAEWPRTPLGQTATPGGLMLTSRSLVELGRLLLCGGGGVVPAPWLAESTRAHVRVDDATEYGYLWWLRAYAGHSSIYMSGAGGNRVHVFPELDLVVVITTTNFGVPGAHALADRLLLDEVLPAFSGG
jgi:CubicO group peptidase (beta-lactamase class C family)